MEQKRFLVGGSGDSLSSSGSRTLSEGEEDVTAVLGIEVSGDGDGDGDGDDGRNSDLESVNGVDRNTDKETQEDEESDGEDEKVSAPAA